MAQFWSGFGVGIVGAIAAVRAVRIARHRSRSSLRRPGHGPLVVGH